MGAIFIAWQDAEGIEARIEKGQCDPPIGSGTIAADACLPCTVRDRFLPRHDMNLPPGL